MVRGWATRPEMVNDQFSKSSVSVIPVSPASVVGVVGVVERPERVEAGTAPWLRT